MPFHTVDALPSDLDVLIPRLSEQKGVRRTQDLQTLRLSLRPFCPVCYRSCCFAVCAAASVVQQSSCTTFHCNQGSQRAYESMKEAINVDADPQRCCRESEHSAHSCTQAGCSMQASVASSRVAQHVHVLSAHVMQRARVTQSFTFSVCLVGQ
jgi:hypothetical protein